MMLAVIRDLFPVPLELSPVVLEAADGTLSLAGSARSFDGGLDMELLATSTTR